jgi:hypothetical protein
LIAPFTFLKSDRRRRIEHAWRYGELAARVVQVALFVLLSILAISLWQGRRLQVQVVRLQARTAKLQSDLAAKSPAGPLQEVPDFVQTLPDAPVAAQVMQTLQQAVDKEGGSVLSMQADDHPSTVSTLGHLDLVVSIKASYPAILVVLQQTLDRYPGATVRQFNVTRSMAPTPITSMAIAPPPGATGSQPTSEAEAHVLLSFWRRPLGVARRMVDPKAAVQSAPATPATSGGR